MFTVLCRHAHSDCQALNHFYMLYESLILCKHGNIVFSLTLKENTISFFTIITIVEIPTQKGEHS